MKHLFALLIPILCISSPALAETQPSPAPAATEEKIDTMTMQRDKRCGQVLVTCLIGDLPMRMMIDTGATHTVLHEESAAKLTQAKWIDTSKMQFRGNSSQHPKIVISELTVGEAKSPEQPFMVLNLESVRRSLAEQLDGILGMDVLGSLPFTFDFRQNKYYWGLPDKAQLIQPYGKQDTYGRFIMHVKTHGRTLPLLLDTGSSITRVREEDWLPGAAGNISAHVGDVDTTAHLQVTEGKAADLEAAPGVTLKNISPIFGQDGQPPVLGVDALREQVLIHLPLEDMPYGVFLLQKP